ncbi:hypothetical protein D7Z54_23710 [Salibacterium salarium]|uniref:Uncharacterized protein n=1 Tax=Salibacterium salarium TaxID=284579 RepID=A0A428MXD9_9BACI|nr:hypothetical protein [Salibacterium salarium]RSL30805.1 hypothetical protein D7Z54_23710 [Salibacterium salarium]
MGYIAPVNNEAAINYGSRMVENEPAITKVDKIPAMLFPPVREEDERNAYRHEQEMDIMTKRREIEQTLYGKGRQFDVDV